MKQIAMVVVIVMVATSAMAFDGEVYFGKLFDSTLRSYPDGGVAEYMAGVEVGHRIGDVRGYVSVDTLCDAQNSDGSFHPASVRYDVGVGVNLFDGIWVEVSHMCWHPVDTSGVIEHYNMVKASWGFGDK